MNEARIQAYMQLIQQLLECPGGEESTILQANSELVDADFVMTMLAAGAQAHAAGQEDVAQFLGQLAMQLRQQMGLELPELEQLAGLGELAVAGQAMELLPVIQQFIQAKSWAESQRIVKQHPELLDQAADQLLQQLMSLAEEEESLRVLQEHRDLLQRCREIGIAEAFEEKLGVSSRLQEMATELDELPPEMRGLIQDVLGELVSGNAQIESPEDLAQFLQSRPELQSRLETAARSAMGSTFGAMLNPERFAGDAQAYGELLQALIQAEVTGGETAVNQVLRQGRERLDAGFIQVMQAWAGGFLQDHADQPEVCEQVGGLLENIGIRILEFPLGTRPCDLEVIITCYQITLEIRTQQNNQPKRAGTLMNQANARLTQAQLGIDPAHNLAQAIANYEESAQIMRRLGLERDLSSTLMNQANALRNQAQLGIDPAHNLAQAIANYEESAQIMRRLGLERDLAGTLHNMGNAHQTQANQDGIDPATHTQAQHAAMQCYREALRYFDPAVLPVDTLKAAGALGNLGYQLGEWHIAIEGFQIAIQAVEQSRSWMTDSQKQREVLENAIGIYERMLQACINIGNLPEALKTVERSRSKYLVDLMATPDLYPDGTVPDEVSDALQEIDTAQSTINQLRRPQSDFSSDGSKELAGAARQARAAMGTTAEIKALEARKQAALNRLRQVDPVTASLKQVDIPDLPELQALLDHPASALLSFYTTDDDTHIFILKPDGLHLFTCQGQGFKTLQSWLLLNWVIPYAAINESNLTPEQRQQRRRSWSIAQPNLLKELAQRLQWDNLLQHEALQGVTELVLVPHLFLHAIPFAALPLANGKFLGDEMQLRYAPGCQVLRFCKDRDPVSTTHIGIVENATEDLPFSNYEGEQVAKLFEVIDQHRLQGAQAKVASYKELLSQVQGLLSSHHAQTRWDNPHESHLRLADNDVTFGHLISPSWRFKNLVEVFLSCCETGLSSNFKLDGDDLGLQFTDEILTLGTGFLCAGARAVISTLWSVDDLATALFSTFYHQRRRAGDNRIASLQAAQQELRALTGAELKTRFYAELHPMLKKQLDLVQAQLDFARDQRRQHRDDNSGEYQQWQATADRWRDLRDRLDDSIRWLDYCVQQDHPFKDPIFWAGFTCSGLA